jgi:hypothetical protein
MAAGPNWEVKMSLGGMPFFDFGEVGFLSNDVGVYGTITFRFEDKVDDLEVVHIVSVKTRVKAGDDVSIGDMREALFQKSVEQLRHALQVAEGKTVRQLSSEAREKAEAERDRWNFAQ